MAEHLLGGAARGAATVSGDLTRSPTRVQVSHVAVEVAEQGTTSALIAHVAVEVAQRGTTSALVAHVAVEVAELLLWVITEAQVQGSATAAGTLTVTGTRLLNGQVGGVATASGALFQSTHLVQGAVGGTATVRGHLLESTHLLQGSVLGTATLSGGATTEKAQITWVAVDVSGTREGSARTTESFVEVVGTAAAGDARTTEGFVEVLFERTFGENRIIWLF